MPRQHQRRKHKLPSNEGMLPSVDDGLLARRLLIATLYLLLCAHVEAQSDVVSSLSMVCARWCAVWNPKKEKRTQCEG